MNIKEYLNSLELVFIDENDVETKQKYYTAIWDFVNGPGGEGPAWHWESRDRFVRNSGNWKIYMKGGQIVLIDIDGDTFTNDTYDGRKLRVDYDQEFRNLNETDYKSFSYAFNLLIQELKKNKEGLLKLDFSYLDIEALLGKNSDVLINHTFTAKEAKSMINKRQLNMKDANTINRINLNSFKFTDDPYKFILEFDGIPREFYLIGNPEMINNE